MDSYILLAQNTVAMGIKHRENKYRKGPEACPRGLELTEDAHEGYQDIIRL